MKIHRQSIALQHPVEKASFLFAVLLPAPIGFRSCSRGQRGVPLLILFFTSAPTRKCRPDGPGSFHARRRLAFAALQVLAPGSRRVLGTRPFDRRHDGLGPAVNRVTVPFREGRTGNVCCIWGRPALALLFCGRRQAHFDLFGSPPSYGSVQ